MLGDPLWLAMVGRLKPLGTGLALAVVLDLLANDQNPHLTKCPKNRGHLNVPRSAVSVAVQ